MKVAIIGAGGRTGRSLVEQALLRGWQVNALARPASIAALPTPAAGVEPNLFAADPVSDRAVLAEALAGCDALVAILLSVGRLKATRLVTSLVDAARQARLSRLVFTAGEVTARPGPGESFSLRQRLMSLLIPPLTLFTPYSVGDMLRASTMIRRQEGWEWTIIRAPTLGDGPAGGYRFCKLHEVRGAHVLPRVDYARALLDSLQRPDQVGRLLTLVPAQG